MHASLSRGRTEGHLTSSSFAVSGQNHPYAYDVSKQVNLRTHGVKGRRGSCRHFCEGITGISCLQCFTLVRSTEQILMDRILLLEGTQSLRTLGSFDNIQMSLMTQERIHNVH